MEETLLFKCEDFFLSSLNLYLKPNYHKLVNWLRWLRRGDGTNTLPQSHGNHGESFAVLVRRGRQTSSVVSPHPAGFPEQQEQTFVFLHTIGWSTTLSFCSCRRTSLGSKWNGRTIATTSDAGDGDIFVDDHKQWHFPTKQRENIVWEKQTWGVWTITVWK